MLTAKMGRAKYSGSKTRRHLPGVQKINVLSLTGRKKMTS
jgi:hypothetical protein